MAKYVLYVPLTDVYRYNESTITYPRLIMFVLKTNLLSDCQCSAGPSVTRCDLSGRVLS